MNKAHRYSGLLVVLTFPICCGCGSRSLSIRYPSSIYVETISKSYPAEAEIFGDALVDRLFGIESSEPHSKPGFVRVVGSEDGEYLLVVEVRNKTDITISGNNTVVHMGVNASLWSRTYGDTKVWSRDLVCIGSTIKDATKQCVDLISDELKSAQVKKGKRAGKLRMGR